MKSYKVRIKTSNKSEIIKADSELEAKVRFCEKRGLAYNAYANNIEAIEKQGGNKK